jgi:hypothetical protein
METEPSVDGREAPEPTAGMLIYDPAHPECRWRVDGVAVDDRIEARRIRPADGILHSWDRFGWDLAWRRGWLIRVR